MSENIVELKPQCSAITTDEYFGGCPTCGCTDGYINVNVKEHWFVCDTHRVRWCAGYGLFSIDDEPMSQDELVSYYRSISYSVVSPIYPEWRYEDEQDEQDEQEEPEEREVSLRSRADQALEISDDDIPF
jgi:hypothetical protein